MKNNADHFFNNEKEFPSLAKREGAISAVPIHVEPHVLLSAVILVCAVGCDALTSMDIYLGRTDAPSSFRVTSLVLVSILASPVLKGCNLTDQRVLIGLLLLMFSLWGLHEASEETRTGDCIFVAIVGLTMVYITNQGGIETERVRPDPQHDTPHRRQTVAALCGALFFYSGLRGLRAAFVSSNVASEYKIEYETLSGMTTTRGYASSSTDTTIPLGFAHGVSICVGVLIALHDETRVVGSSSVAYEVGAAGLVMTVSATWALLGMSTQMEALHVLYGSGACKGDINLCYESARARRLVMANNNSGSAWITGLAALAFSFSIERRLLYPNTRAKNTLRRQGFGFSLAMLITSIVGVLQYARFEGDQFHTDVILLVSLVAVFVSATTDTLVGTLIYTIVMTYEQVQLLNNYGSQFVFVHLTHVTLFVSLLLMWVWVTFMVLKSVLSCFYQVKNESVINKVIGISTATGTSLTFGLFMASSLLLAASNGNLPQEDDVFRGGSPRRSMISFVLCHFVPLLVWVPTYVCRCEVVLISSWTRATAWLSAVPFDALIYVLVLRILGESAPTAILMQVSGVSVVGVPAIVAWALGAFV